MSFDPSATRSGTIFSDVPNYAGAWVCYINGIEVPVMGWQVDTQIWQVPSFTIHCVPDPVLQRLGTEDRVPVQIFYLDYWAEDTPKFRLLVDGEIVGWSFSSSTGSRTIAFSCLAHIQIFQQLYFFFMTNVDDIVASRSPEVLSKGFSTPGLLYPYALFHQGLLSTGAQATQITPRYNSSGRAVSAGEVQAESDKGTTEDTAPILCPYEMVVNVIKGVISTKVPTERRAVPMMNFFARYIRKMRFHNRWVRLPLLEDAESLDNRVGVFPIFNAARNDEALMAMQRQVVSQTGSSGPVWNLFQQVLTLVHMEIAMLINPACVRVKLAPYAPNKPDEGRILGPLSHLDPLTTYRRGLVLTGDADTDPIYREALGQAQAEFEPRNEGGPTQTPETPPQNQAPVPVNGQIQPTADMVFTVEEAIQETARVNYQNLGADRVEQLATQNATDVEATDARQPVRLAQYFVKPNFYFGETPSCNVIMPSMIDSWTFDESYINQATRVYVNDGVLTRSLRATGNNREFMLHALTVGWPEEANALMRHKVGTDNSQENGTAAHGSESGRNLLVWPEEFYKGPVVARTALPSWFQMLRQFSNSRGTPRPNAPPPDPQTAPFYHPAEPAPVGSGVLLQGSTAAAADFYVAPAEPTSGNPATPQGAAQNARSTDNASTPPATPPIPGSPNATTTPSTSRSECDRSRDPKLERAFCLAAPVLLGGTRHGQTAVRLTVGGSREVNHCLETGSGLDPANYVVPQITAPWPMSENPEWLRQQQQGPRRGRQTNTRSAPRWVPSYDVVTRMAILTIALKNRLASEAPFNTLTPDQQTVAAFGFMWISFQETSLRVFRSWGIGNQKQYRLYPPRKWTVEPWCVPYEPYIAATSFEEGLSVMWDHFRRQGAYMAALQTMITGDAPPALRQLLIEADAYASPFWERYGRIRPDLFYMHLGYIGYYAGRLPAGISRTRAMASYFPRVLRLIESGHVPAPINFVTDYDPALIHPLYLPEAAPLLNVRVTDPSSTAPSGGTVSPNELAQEGDGFSKLFELYAQYDYMKNRYGQRSAGANLRFNPYLVVGFPAMLFDSQRTGMHTVGYVVGVGHSANASSGGASMSTVVRLQFCRTFQEFIYDVRADAARFEGRVTSAPAEIIDEVRAVIQDDRNAEVFYRRLFYGGQRPRQTLACFRWDAVMAFSKNIFGENIEIRGETAATLVENDRRAREAREAAADNTDQPANPGPPATQGDRNAQVPGNATPPSTQATTTPIPTPQAAKNNLADIGPISPKPGTAYAAAFDNYHIAMQLASRPACSLEDFIRFWHAGETVNALIGRGLVSDPQLELAYGRIRERDVTRQNADGTLSRSNVSRASATYYGRIFKLRLGPGQPPTESERGYTSGPDIDPSAENKGVDKDYPETRADWDSLLLLYRDRVRNLLSSAT